MSIPERFYRIAKHKLTEIKDRIDQWDAEAQEDPEVVEKRRQKRARNVAKRELDDAMTDPATTGKPPAVDVAPVPLNPPPARRTPEEIARGSRSYASTGPAGSTTSSAQPLSQPDPLEYHYRLLGVEVGTDFTTVQAAYNK